MKKKETYKKMVKEKEMVLPGSKKSMKMSKEKKKTKKDCEY